ncbi:N-fatty-acyl-amino acid synthase/hydrolase PM20D1.2-like [Acanthaster planci]|uniref:N-fatty-acyl-amino acid synthase/hydrolase PM20D1.2-like n=1 Tax=Acanthaster planci TaxID=133434 RepID=A0A8B7ZUQ9_ACAPL|nr:N-fatty-acyl-amino acid synthase/hydrolase PM20D1.2-like [Acanthaster planci]XP_022107247.1 N-fatty-acyl-amino acid synthase/hydrolase PM20D1.2-like [Acanthaster planci]
MLLSILSVATAGLSGLAAILVLRAITAKSKQPKPSGLSLDTTQFDGNRKIVTNLQEAIRIETVSRKPGDINYSEILKFHAFLQKVFPKVHSSPLVTREVIASYSLLYTVEGSNPSLKPYILAAHIDVVPVDGQDWDVPPFEGREQDGCIYGRGTIDDKHSLMGILEALESRLERQEKPVRSIYLCFGHDEEVTGLDGAANIGKTLQERGVQAEFLLDEGYTILQDVIKHVHRPVGLIGVSEKGHATLRLSVDTAETGHSSMPPKETNVGILAKAVSKLETTPFPSMFGSGVEYDNFVYLASEVEYPIKLVFANLWLFKKIVERIMQQKESTRAILHTSTAITVFRGGVKVNVLPPSASAIVNHRIHPSQTIQQVLERDRRLINDDRIKMEILQSREATITSPYDEQCFAYQSIGQSIQQVFPDAIVAPAILLANTDTVHYTSITDKLYRFCPTFNLPEDVPRFHGVNERIRISNYEQVVKFYYILMHHADREQL